MRIDRVRLFAAMTNKDISATNLSKLANVSRATISSIRGGKTCSEETALKIAKALDVKVVDILESNVTRKENV